mmetsp:Transcript_44764/g.74687  ORF Transcript_44764/g.74687 Transcript_44764/m.74687 type:complete len:418 (+) Transcript_44764:352-1605(+)|eukprot:CAMPEP_0198207356 /NCGR_PEP_ID=MMETSP1445-20131203/10811_1 /TAXON_ID=36898 /ORGANISM="Pyramimonas sp., Strain CCMP2087" /LENGTH=417 /DNA_ID=CAMNT_0043880353 /DNA_START=289 /DNA_END=1542 /DNA_ORIENTATION=+
MAPDASFSGETIEAAKAYLSITSSGKLKPGKLGNPDLFMKDDERGDPRMRAALDGFGMGGSPARTGLEMSSSSLDPKDKGPTEEKLFNYADKVETGVEQLLSAMVAGAPKRDVINYTKVVRGVDGNDIQLYISEPKEHGPVPCIIHLHGGEFSMLSATNGFYSYLRESYAAQGLVAISVEFRNTAGKHGRHPFPAALNDCFAALEWVNGHKPQLGVSVVILNGESSGGNLCIATALKAVKEGKHELVDGVYAAAPEVYGKWSLDVPDSTKKFPSLMENDGYLNRVINGVPLSWLYSQDYTNPLAWPFAATKADLVGLPPVLIQVNELDPIRDEGVAFAEKCELASVPTELRLVKGQGHVTDLMFPKEQPDVYDATVAAVKDFAIRCYEYNRPAKPKRNRDCASKRACKYVFGESICA